MRLLMITRKVDYQDASPAGFTYNWVKKISQKVDKLYVIAWQKSNQDSLPDNVELKSLPNNKLLKIIFLKLEILRLLPKVNGLFCQQNPEYTIIAAPLAKIFGKRVVSWYTHKDVSWRLKTVNLLADRILSASKESCRLKDRKKIRVIGHGIDTNHFKPAALKPETEESQTGAAGSFNRLEQFQSDVFKIISIGRISPIKNYETFIEAINILVNQKNIKNIIGQIIGVPVLKEEQKLKLTKLLQSISEEQI